MLVGFPTVLDHFIVTYLHAYWRGGHVTADLKCAHSEHIIPNVTLVTVTVHFVAAAILHSFGRGPCQIASAESWQHPW